MHKKDVPTVGQTLLNTTEKLNCKNSDFNACDAGGRLSGRRNRTVSPAANTGSDYGLPRIAQSGCYPGCPVTANSLSTKLRITGLSELRKLSPTSLRSGTWFMTLPIFIRTAVC